MKLFNYKSKNEKKIEILEYKIDSLKEKTMLQYGIINILNMSINNRIPRIEKYYEGDIEIFRITEKLRPPYEIKSSTNDYWRFGLDAHGYLILINSDQQRGKRYYYYLMLDVFSNRYMENITEPEIILYLEPTKIMLDTTN